MLSHNKTQMNFNSAVQKLARCKDLVAVLEANNKLSLHDLASSRMMWEVPVKNQEEYHCHSLKVSSQGVVLYLSYHQSSDLKHPALAQIFYQGKQTGVFWMYPLCLTLETLRLSRDRIFAFSPSDHETHFIEWDIKGTPLQSIYIPNIDNGCDSLVASNQHFYLVCSHSEFTNYQTQIFVFDLVTNVGKTFTVGEKENLRLDEIYVHKDELICAFHPSTLGIGFFSSNNNKPRLKVIDITREEIRHEMMLPDNSGHIRYLSANDNYIVYLLDKCQPRSSLYCISKLNNEITPIKIIPGNKEERIQLALKANRLTICYAAGLCQYNQEGSIESSLIDLTIPGEIASRTFKRLPYPLFSFANSKLLIPDTDKILIEDLSDTDLEEKLALSRRKSSNSP